MHNLAHAPTKARRAYHLDGLAALGRYHGLVCRVRLMGQPACAIGLHQHAVGEDGKRPKAQRRRAQLSGSPVGTLRASPHADHAGVPKRLLDVELRGVKQERAALGRKHVGGRGDNHRAAQLARKLVHEGRLAAAPHH